MVLFIPPNRHVFTREKVLLLKLGGRENGLERFRMSKDEFFRGV